MAKNKPKLIIKNSEINKPVNKKQKKLTIASCFRELAIVQSQNELTLATSIESLLNKSGVTVTSDIILRQIKAMSRDIQKNRNGWWSKYKVIKTEKLFQIVQK